MGRPCALAASINWVMSREPMPLRRQASAMTIANYGVFLGIVAGLSANLPEHAQTATGLRDREMSTVASLHAWAVAEAEELAARFDARGGAPHYAAQLDRARAATPAEHPLPEEALPELPEQSAPSQPGGAAARGEPGGSPNGDELFDAPSKPCPRTG